MMKKSNLKLNVIYQTLYQLLATALPLITSPYIARVLGSDSLGIYSYTSSIATYFMLFAMLGVNNYGTKSIAIVRNDRQKRSKVFCEIFGLQIFCTIIFTTLYFILIFIMDGKFLFISLLQGIMIINCLFDINWLYFGLEEIKITVTRNCCMKIITLVSIFLLVHNQNDLWIYTLIMTVSTLLSELILFINLKNYIDLVNIDIRGIFSHLKNNIVLFIPILALSVYHYMDKTMLGILSTTTESGYYYNVDRIINVPTGIIIGFGTVMLPRFSQLVGKNNNSRYNELFEKTIELLMFVTTPLVFGIYSISDIFIPWFLGDGYQSCNLLLKVLVWVIYFKSISQIIRTQYLIPKNKNKEYILAISVGALINLVLNYVLIIKFNALGAIIGTLISEGLVCLDHVRVTNMDVSINKFIKNNLIYVAFGFIMSTSIYVCDLFIVNISTVLLLVINVILGGIIYLTLCYLYWIKKKSGLFYDTLKNKLSIFAK